MGGQGLLWNDGCYYRIGPAFALPNRGDRSRVKLVVQTQVVLTMSYNIKYKTTQLKFLFRLGAQGNGRTGLSSLVFFYLAQYFNKECDTTLRGLSQMRYSPLSLRPHHKKGPVPTLHSCSHISRKWFVDSDGISTSCCLPQTRVLESSRSAQSTRISPLTLDRRRDNDLGGS